MYGMSVNTQQKQKQKQKVDNAAGSPRVAAGSPRVAAGSPRTSTVSPRHNNFGSPKAKGSPKTAEVGEIDTRAPFQSVKAAVSLFGETGASPRSPAAVGFKKTTTTTKSAEERVVEKENQLHLALNQLDAYKIQLRNSEATKAQALRDLEEARRTLQDLSAKIGSMNEWEQAAAAAPPVLHITIANSPQQLNSVKQQLSQLRHDFDAAMEAKTAAIQKASRAQNAAVVNRERVIELSKEVASLRHALAKLTSLHSQEEQHAKVMAGKQASLKSLQKAKEEAEAKMQAIKEEFDPDLAQHLKVKLDQTNKEIEVLREKLKNAKTADLNAWKTAASELETAKKAMQEVVALENSLRSQVDSLQQELENNPDKLKNNNNPSSSKEEEEELRASIRRREDSKDDDCDYIASKILQLTSEAELAIQEAEEMKKYAESFRKEAETARIAAKEAEEKLESVLKEARTARLLADSSTTPALPHPPAISKLNGKINLSKDEYESLKNKIEHTKKLPESKSKRMGITSCRSGCFN